MRTLWGLLFIVGALSAGAQVKPDLTAGNPSDAQIKARKIFERLAGIKAPIDSPVVIQMTELVLQGKLGAAADLAMQDPNFLNITVKQMALKTSTREENIKQPLNDYTAYWIGLVRDDSDARELLTGNYYYIGDPTKIPATVTVRSNLANDIVGSNNHYADLETKISDVGSILLKVSGQQISSGAGAGLMANPDPAGIVTSRTFLASHVLAGTNRRAIEYTFREFMCIPIGEWADTSAPDLRIGPDIDRYPGGDHARFETTCKGCHTQMDGLRGAFAFWDANSVTGGAIYTAGKAASKYTRNKQVFPEGFIVTDNSFVNNSNGGTNAQTFEWREQNGANITYGNGVAQLGNMIANSKRFSQCMTRRVFEAACKRDFNIKSNLAVIKKYATQFESQNYSFKKLFRTVATAPECMGE